MAFGNFTLTGQFFGLDGVMPATGRVQIDGIPQVIIDTGSNKIRVGPRTVTLDSQGAFSITLPSDATTGNSTTIGFRVTPTLKHQNLPPIEFYARAIGSTVDLKSITPQIVEQVVPSGQNAAAAAASATAAATSATAAATSATTTQTLHDDLPQYWKANRAYAARQAVLAPTGELVHAKVAFTSGATYDATKWNYTVESGEVSKVTVTAVQPTVPASGEAWIPTTDWVEGHTHPQYADQFGIRSQAGGYSYLWGSAPTTTSNLGQFSGALFGRLKLAPFHWSELSTAFQSAHIEVTTAGTGFIRAGIYAHDVASGGPLGTSGPLVDMGQVDVSTIGQKAFTVPFTLARGWYWLGWTWQGTNTTGPVIRGRTPVSPFNQWSYGSLDLTLQRFTFYPAAAALTGNAVLPPLLASNTLNLDDTVTPSIAFRRV